MKEITSPDSYINMGFYFMIGAALGRRVWLGSSERPIFPNMYIILVGEPGIGKGLVIRPVDDILRSHRIGGARKPPKHDLSEEQLNAINKQVEEVSNKVEDLLNRMNKSGNEHSYSKRTKGDELLFPIAAQATTFEALVQAHGACIRGINVAKCAWAPSGIYFHNSLVFLLEELSSLFRKKSESLVNYLIVAYDCGNYEYTTVHRGTDIVKRMCLNLFGGTQPDFLQETFADKLLTQGYASRTLFVFEHSNRFEKFLFDEPTAEQTQAKRDLIDWTGELGKLFGSVSFSPEAHNLLTDYFENKIIEAKHKAHPSLKPYFARKKVHACKLAMAIHFGETMSMELSLYDCERALDLLSTIENKMHHALTLSSKNPVATLAKNIHVYLLQNGPSTMMSIYQAFFDTVRQIRDLEEALHYLLATKEVITEIRDKKTYYIGVKI